MANNRKHDRWLSDEQVETEIAVLKQSPRVALARAEQKEKCIFCGERSEK